MTPRRPKAHASQAERVVSEEVPAVSLTCRGSRARGKRDMRDSESGLLRPGKKSVLLTVMGAGFETGRPLT